MTQPRISKTPEFKNSPQQIRHHRFLFIQLFLRDLNFLAGEIAPLHVLHNRVVAFAIAAAREGKDQLVFRGVSGRRFKNT